MKKLLTLCICCGLAFSTIGCGDAAKKTETKKPATTKTDSTAPKKDETKKDDMKNDHKTDVKKDDKKAG